MSFWSDPWRTSALTSLGDDKFLPESLDSESELSSPEVHSVTASSRKESFLGTRSKSSPGLDQGLPKLFVSWLFEEDVVDAAECELMWLFVEGLLL
eukprot:5884990-Heterocapsa_arctica.AAC.1